MNESYVAQIRDGIVVQVIVGNAEWANATLGGTWIDSDTLVGVGWIWDGTIFAPLPSLEPEPDLP